MKIYKNFNDLVIDWQNLTVPGGIYIEAIKKDDLMNAQFYSISSKEFKEQEIVETEFGNIPESLFSLKVKYFLDTQTFQDIIEVKFDHNPNLKLTDIDVFLKATIYYLEMDDFLE